MTRRCPNVKTDWQFFDHKKKLNFLSTIVLFDSSSWWSLLLPGHQDFLFRNEPQCSTWPTTELNLIDSGVHLLIWPVWKSVWRGSNDICIEMIHMVMVSNLSLLLVATFELFWPISNVWLITWGKTWAWD